MGINVSCKTKAKASLKLLNQISTYLFEQEFDELRGQSGVISALQKAQKELSKLIKDSKA